ncbi:hypothetical protein EI77_02135 [Prosthecobacter fusiformis]|uniref:Uncharacterized protein n=1 Tax=Prosthecobacter fusiformis TaxID=48464 RepID=A0A4R7S1Z4_9BACT|nr:hypothetical protein [Prosthecobacter fusiformis]TDU71017.1 hypothetical protein EI77_02135 [Prosthecobacter fusiformis]
MSRAAVFVSLFFISSLGAQETAPEVPQSPPPVPGSPTLSTPVAPPLPGQLQALPAAVPPSALAALPPLGGPAASAIPPLSKPKSGSSTSTSGQFIVHGDDLTLRSALSSKCEDISKELRTLLHDKQSWALPVVVLVNSGEAARKADKTATTVISQLTHGGFHIQVNVNFRPDLRPTDLRKEIIRALLAERILRDQKEITAQRKLLLPDWLFLGILEASDYRQRARPSTLFAAIFKSGKIFGIEEIIEASASDIDDSLSKTIYQTSCCALVLALLDQPESGLRMGKFLNALASDPRSERELLNQWFPNFAASDASLNKWWALQLATLASPGMGEPLSPQDTLAALEEALTFRIQAKPSELPATSRRVVATVKPSPPRAAAPEPLRVSQAAVDEPVLKPEEIGIPPEITVEEGSEKRGLMSRLNPFPRRKTSDDEIDAAIEAAARAESESSAAALPEDLPESVETAPEVGTGSPGTSKRKPLLNRLFTEEGKAETSPAEAKPKAAPEKKAAPVKPAEESEAEKPSNLNPMNWFRGGKKGKEEKSTEESPAEDKDKKASVSSPRDPLVAELLSDNPVCVLVMQQVGAEAEKEESAEGKKRFFGMFGKKKTEDDPAEPEAPKKTEAAASENKKAEAGEAVEKEKRGFPRLPFFGDKKNESPEETTVEEPSIMLPVEPAPAPKAKALQPKAAAKSLPPEDEKPIAATIPIEDYAVILKRKDLTQILERNVVSLGALQNRAAVLFRPIIGDYLLVMQDLLKGKTKGLDDRLRTLRTRTQEARTKTDAVRDLLDLHEANDTPAMSGLFEDYLKLPETIQNELPPRTDPISKYLDALDKEFSKE